MAEPLPYPNPAAAEAMAGKAESLVIGETPVYLTNPVTVGSETITSFTILGKDQRSVSGGGSAVILTKEPSRKKENRGELVEKEHLNLDRMDSKDWDSISGIRFRDEAGNAIDIPKEKLTLEQLPEPASSGDLGVSNLGNLGNLEENPKSQETPNTITIVGLRALEGRALDLADRSMQKLSKDIGTVIWKQSVGGIYFHERARQYYLDMLKASETPFAEDAIRLAERRATDIYNKKLADSNFLVRAGTRTVDWLKDKVGMRTTIQTLALEEIGRMKAAGEITGMETLEREAKAVRARFEKDFENAGNLVRETLGEKKLTLLDETDTRNTPIVNGIKKLMSRYATGEIADKKALDEEAKTFFAETLKGNRPDLVPEAELYTSSLFEAAENLRAKVSHEAGIANIDAALSGIQVKLGLAQMGEVTSLDPTAVERGIGKVREVVEWLQKKHILTSVVFNEASIGTGVALTLSTISFFKTVPASAFGAGALAGGLFAGWREYGQLHKDYLTHLREREAGAKLTETQKRRQWFERFAPQQRSAAEMTKTIEDAMVSGDYRTVMATIADLQARKAVSETGPKRIGLVQYSSREAIESERTALDLAASKALGDLSTLSNLGDLLGGNDFPQFMEKLTVLQTRVLREGVQVLTTQDDPVNATLNLVSQYAPEANLIKRRWPFVSAAVTSVKAAGLDAILEEFKKEARLESVKYGVKAGVVGSAVGAAFHGIGELFANRVDAGETLHTADLGTFTTVDTAPTTGPIELTGYSPDHTLLLNGTHYQLPNALDITSHAIGYPDDRVIDYSAVLHTPNGNIVLGSRMDETHLKSVLEKTGLSFQEAHTAGSQTLLETDMNMLAPDGVTHITANVTEGYELQYVPDHHNWQLVDTANNQAITTMQFDSTGKLLGTTEQLHRINEQLSAHGLEIRNPENFKAVTLVTETGPTTETIAVTPDQLIFNNDMTIESKDLGNGGMWDYFLGKTDNVTDANGMKNLFRIYTHNQDNNNITFDDTSPHKDYVAEHLRTAHYGGTEVQEFDLARIPNDAHIELDSRIFGEDGIQKFHRLSTDGLERMNEVLATHPDLKGPMQAIKFMDTSPTGDDTLYATALRLGYVGQDDKLPTADAVNKLMAHLMGGSDESVQQAAQTITTSETVKESIGIHAITIQKITPEATPAIISAPGNMLSIHYITTEAANQVNEAFIKYDALKTQWPGGFDESYRAALHSDAWASVNAQKFPWFPIFIPYRSVLEAAPETMVTTAETAPVRERKPQSVAVKEYLDALSEDEKQLPAGLDLPPVSPDLRAAIIIPVSQFHGTTITNRLEPYLSQDALAQSEFLVFDTVGVKKDVDKFLTEHPDMKVLYVAGPSYAEATAGKVKRDATNIIMSRVATMPEDSPDVAVVMDNGTGGQLQSTYLSGIINAFDANPAVETVGGAYALPEAAYSGFPMLFARFRAVELMDALIRHGEAGGIPPTYAGNLGIRAASLASVGGYKPETASGEDRVLMQAVGNWQTLPAMTATFDPKEMSYTTLQSLNLADANVPLSQNETYKDMSWEEMAKRANDAYTKEHLEADLSRIYAAMPHDEYFKRTMDALGIQYELKDGNVTVLSTESLAQNMAAPIDIEEFAKAETTPREQLEKMAGDIPEPSAETPTEATASTLSSPDVSHLSNLGETPQKQEIPMGVEDRMNHVLKKSKDTQAAVQLTPGELMDYLKSSIDIQGTRITGGTIAIDGTTVTLTDVVADVHRGAARLGDAKFSATLITDPDKGLTIDKQSFNMQLPWTLKLFSGEIHKKLDSVNDVILTHINTVVDPAWQASRIDVVGEKLEIKFAKKA